MPKTLDNGSDESAEVVRGEELRREVFALADAAFLQRRKTLRAALGGHFGGASTAEDVLRAAGIDPKERGEKLSIGDYVRLARTSLVHAATTGGGSENDTGAQE